jgi:hypothetical protein
LIQPQEMAMPRRRAWRTIVAIATVTATCAASLALAASAAADNPGDLPVVVDLSTLSSFADSGGNSIAIASDQTVGAERTITGSEPSGTPVVIKVYLNSPTSGDATDNTLLATTAAEGGVDDTSTPVVPEPTTPDTAGFVPQVVTATTPTTITVAWKAPAAANQFDLTVNGSPLPVQAAPNFTLTGLNVNVAYDLDMESSHDTAATTPTVPTPPMTDACPSPQGVATTDMSTWDLSQSGSTGVSLLAPGGLRVITTDVSADGEAAGYFPVSQGLANIGSPTLDWQGTTTKPSLQLITDFNNDGTPDGTLVGETAYGDDWWVPEGTAQFVKDGAPEHGSGSGSTNHGTLAEWETAFPNAKVLQVGYSLGPSAQGDGVISSITAGCTEYSFGIADSQAPATTIGDASSYLSVHTLQLLPAGESASVLKSKMKKLAATSASGTSVESTEFQYRTFIPYDTLADSPYPGDQAIVYACLAAFHGGYSGDDTFIGDDRGFEAPNPDPSIRNYRTMMDYKVDWNNDTVTHNVQVGDTDVVNKQTGEIVETKHAGTGGMNFASPTLSANFASVEFNHVANDPYCPSLFKAGAISYDVNVSFYRSGLITVYGQRFTMPSHEGWVRWNDEATWTNVFEQSASQLGCLIGGSLSTWPFPNPCVQNIAARLNRTTDGWSEFDGMWGATTSGKIWGSGVTTRLAPHGGGSSTCFALSIVEAPSLPDGVLAGDIYISDVFRSRPGDHWATALGADHHIYTWGRAEDYELGRVVGLTNPTTPTAVDGREYKDFVVNGTTTYAVTTDGDVYTWGDRFSDNSDPAGLTPYSTPTLALAGDDIQKIAIGNRDALALDSSGHLYHFGEVPPTTDDPVGFHGWESVPAAGVTFTDIAANGGERDDDYAIDTDGRLWSWNGQTVVTAATNVDNGWTMSAVPSLVSTDHLFKKISGGSNVVAVTRDGSSGWWSAFSGPGLRIDNYLLNVNDPPVPLHNLSPNDEVGIDDTGAAWSWQEDPTYSFNEWVDLGLPPSRDQDQEVQC